ncbi:glycoside hydrolase family 9 protein [Colwellia psychrerythraea]|uniref:Glycoside hydrolase family 9 n=1 Tax=Colwellia psychrerythraea TaxID=28229 RepID=A0A099KVA4_COLPS|nr:glycoside hydrolase family 9 protein [Colwellia psychrerythraea]KGJ94516.1 glycoside hydrolase family 9 [Colwellia psychrerythraea]
MTAACVFSSFSKRVLLILVVLITACSSKPQLSNPPKLTTADIYVNQVAFDTRSPKQAVVVLPIGETATRFIVYQGSSMIYQGKLAYQPNFTEWGAGAHYYLADFSQVKRRGEFHIVVNTPKQQLASSTFIIKHNAYFALTAKSLVNYFRASRHTDPSDESIRINGTDRYVNVSGGWVNAGGDQGKHLSQHTDANFLVPQQGAIAVWAMAKSYNSLNRLYQRKALAQELAEEVTWGADYLHRILDREGYFYNNIDDQRGLADERVITGYDGPEGDLNTNFQAAFREGGGIAIAALVRAHELSNETGVQGEFSAKQYLLDAERAFAHLQKNNLHYVDNGEENIIDDYTALIAATELYRITKKSKYLKAARHRAHNLNNRMTSQGWFVSDDNDRPFYHGVESGFPIIALADYLAIEKNRQMSAKTKRTIKLSLDYQLTLNSQVANPFNLARQTFKTCKDRQCSTQKQSFFTPQTNENSDIWQGESSRLTSLTAAAIWGGKITHSDKLGAFGINDELAYFAQSQMDWVLGKNPYQVSMLYGFGVNNPPHAQSAGTMLNGGISNGITGATSHPDGRGITWAQGPDENDWRWVEQWLQNSTWYLLAMTAMTE